MISVILGATAGLGRALGESLAAAGHGLLLAGRDDRDLDAQARHLTLSYGVRVETVIVDAFHVEECVDRLYAAAVEFQGITGLFLPLGLHLEADKGDLPPQDIERLVKVNFLTVICAVERFRPLLEPLDDGVIVGFGSIAALRGRGSNIVYGASKRGLKTYFEGLRHLAVNVGPRIQFYQLGYMDTQQTYGRNLLFPKANPKTIAGSVVRNLGRDRGIIYLPRFWGIVAVIISVLPWFVFKRLRY